MTPATFLRRLALVPALPLLVAGCTLPEWPFHRDPPSMAQVAGPDTIRPMPRPDSLIRGVAPQASAAAYDTTSAAERAAATAPPASGEVALGTAVVGLGSPTDPGFWLETPLVGAPARGRVATATASVNVDLRPSAAGSRLSLPAMRLLGLPLTSLSEVRVYRLPD
jgi:hypothetical protein